MWSLVRAELRSYIPKELHSPIKALALNSIRQVKLDALANIVRAIAKNIFRELTFTISQFCIIKFLYMSPNLK